jgi:integrase
VNDDHGFLPAVVAEGMFLTPELEEHVATARELRASSRSGNTRRSYATGWSQFMEYVATHAPEQPTLPASPVTVALFLASLHAAERTADTLRSRSSAIAFYHRQAGHPSPCDHVAVKEVLEGAVRKGAGRQHGRATVAIDDLEDLLSRLPEPNTPLALRDRALALLTFGSGRRRSEIAALDVEHLDFRRNPRFLFVSILKSKTDQRGRGAIVAVPRLPAERQRACAVVALSAWLAHHPTKTGPLFPSFVRGTPKVGKRIDGRVVADALKRLFLEAEFPPEHVAAIAAHSLRRGFVTSADAAGMTHSQIGAVTGQKDPRTIARYAVHELTKDPPLLGIIRSSNAK